MVEIGVTLQVMWTGPSGSISSGALIGSGISYISTITVTAVNTSDSGSYTCTASLNSIESFLVSSATTTGFMNIYIGKYIH